MVRGFKTVAGKLGARSVKAVSLRETGPPESRACGEIPLERAGDAHRLLQGRTSIGKIVFAVRDGDSQ
jgi:hypothetical protein